MGYVGKRMSERAAKAYENDERPKSKWTKKEMLCILNDIRDDLDFSKIRKERLFEEYFYCSSWHHTGALYNETDFYTVYIDEVLKATQEEINAIVEEEKHKTKQSPQYTQEQIERRMIRQINKERKEKKKENERLKDLFQLQDKYKTFATFKKHPELIKEVEKAVKEEKEAKEKAIQEKIDTVKNLYNGKADELVIEIRDKHPRNYQELLEFFGDRLITKKSFSKKGYEMMTIYLPNGQVVTHSVAQIYSQKVGFHI